MQGRSVFRGIRSTACLGESNPFHSIPLPHGARPEARKRRKKCADSAKSERRKEGAIEQFFELGLAAAVKTKASKLFPCF